VAAGEPPASDAPRADGGHVHDGFLEATLSRFEVEADLAERGLPTVPTASVNYGAAGVAYLFYRLACLRGTADLLTAADHWVSYAHREQGHPRAFHNRDIGITSKHVGRVSIYHSSAGVDCVEALIANAMGDVVRAHAAVGSFVAASRRPCQNPDVTVGRAGSLVGAALLTDALQATDVPQAAGLVEFGNDCMSRIWADLAHLTCQSPEIRYLGVAHGWAGLLYATLLWCTAAHSELPSGAEARIEELAALGKRTREGLHWPKAGDRWRPSGWCHGSSGYVHLWRLAGRFFGEARYSDLTVGAAEYARARRENSGTLCCGLGGQAYAMLAAYKLTGDQAWVRHAEQMACDAVGFAGTSSFATNSLYKGDVGVALLLADLERPSTAAMPLFESEGW
jgi:eukaryotic-like serine/threonine-protein kinase